MPRVYGVQDADEKLSGWMSEDETATAPTGETAVLGKHHPRCRPAWCRRAHPKRWALGWNHVHAASGNRVLHPVYQYRSDCGAQHAGRV